MLAQRVLVSLAVGTHIVLSDAFAPFMPLGVRPARCMGSGLEQATATRPVGDVQRLGMRRSERLAMKSEPSDVYSRAIKQLETFQREEYLCPWWAKDGNVNTLAGALFATPKTPPYRRERWDTDDGGFVDIDFLESQEDFTRGMVVLMHGLESCSTAPLTIRQAKSFIEAGFDVAAVNFRGCSKDENGEQVRRAAHCPPPAARCNTAPDRGQLRSCASPPPPPAQLTPRAADRVRDGGDVPPWLHPRPPLDPAAAPRRRPRAATVPQRRLARRERCDQVPRRARRRGARAERVRRRGRVRAHQPRGERGDH